MHAAHPQDEKCTLKVSEGIELVGGTILVEVSVQQTYTRAPNDLAAQCSCLPIVENALTPRQSLHPRVRMAKCRGVLFS